MGLWVARQRRGKMRHVSGKINGNFAAPARWVQGKNGSK